MSKKVLFELARELISAKKELSRLCAIRNSTYKEYVVESVKYASLLCINSIQNNDLMNRVNDLYYMAIVRNCEFYECFLVVKNLEGKLFDTMNSGISNREYQRVIDFIEASV